MEVDSSGSVMYGHLSSLSVVQTVAITLIHKLVQTESPPQEHSSFSVLSIDDVLEVQSRRRADVGGLFSKVGHIEGDSSLPLDIVEDGIHNVESKHVLVHLADCFAIQLLEGKE